MTFKFVQNAPEGEIVEISPGRKMIKQGGRWRLYFNNNATAAGWVDDAELASLNAEQDAADAALQQEIDDTEAALLAQIAGCLSKLGGTVTGDTTFEKRIGVPAVSLAALDIDLASGTYFKKVVNGNSTFTFSNPPPSTEAHAFTLLIQHTSGTISFPATVKFPNDSALSLTSGKFHLFTFTTDNGGASWRGSVNSNYSA